MKKQRNVVLFLVKFFTSYFLFFVIYSVYLNHNQERNTVYKCDQLTVVVAQNTKALIAWANYDIQILQHPEELSMQLILNGSYTARVIEGCNSASVIILFLAFIIAFKGSLMSTVIFGLIGSLIIYLINVGRIALLTILLYKYPNYQEYLHNLVFPAIIYGATFLLWVIWVNYISSIRK